MSFKSRPIRERWFRPKLTETKKRSGSSGRAKPIGKHAFVRGEEGIDDGQAVDDQPVLHILAKQEFGSVADGDSNDQRVKKLQRKAVGQVRRHYQIS